MSELPDVRPMDEHNRTLVENVRPPDWTNPTPAGRYNLVVIGGGTAGLVSAVGAAGLGARVALIEKHLLGGDCLNVGCVPSKSLIRSARAAADAAEADRFGLTGGANVRVDFAAVMARVREIRARISEHDSARRLTELGVDVFLGEGRFVGAGAIDVAGQTLRFARAVIGAGPIGCELAQAFGRLGAEVTLIHRHGQILPREDPDAAAILDAALRREGVTMCLNAHTERVEASADGHILHLSGADGERAVMADAILVGAGRQPNVAGLGLETVGVTYDEREGVRVDDHLRTTNRRIYAAGDVCSRLKFTHAADAAARIVLQNALLGGRKKFSALHVPWCTYTSPEIAHVGLTRRGAAEAGVPIDTYCRRLADVDRAVTDGAEEGFVKIHVKRRTDRVVGATIVAPHAGEMISEITLAMVAPLGLGALAGVIHPYPTQAEAIKQVADEYQRTRLTPRVAAMLTWLLGRRR